MKLSKISEMLGCLVLSCSNKLDIDIKLCMASDMMSDMLAYAKPGALLITGLTNTQSVRTAEIADSAGIIYVRGKRPDEQTVSLAEELGIPLLSTTASMFETCWVLRNAGLVGIC
jgi:predicted transcriptional regulator